MTATPSPSTRADEMTKHTPGPWEISHEPPRWIIQAEHGPGKKAVAYMVGDYIECAANARLIAAAPELLEALTLIIGLWDNDQIVPLNPSTIDVTGFFKAREALAKATGAP